MGSSGIPCGAAARSPTRPTRTLPGRRRSRWLAVLLGTALGLTLAEVGCRWLTRVDADGKAWFLAVPLDPFRVDPAELQQQLERLLDGRSVTEPHPRTGWALAAGRRANRGFYCTDQRGARCSGSPDPGPPAARRVLAVGDSFTFCSEVRFEESWPALLEGRLADTEVINLGVPGFGLDQAALLLEERIDELRPDVVLVGLIPADLRRHINIFRSHLQQTSWPLSKPRFVLGPEGQLDAVNLPCVAPEAMPEILAQLPDHPLGAFDAWCDPPWLARQDPLGSRLGGATWAVLRAQRRWQLEERCSERGPEGLDLCRAILERLRGTCAARDVALLGVLIPSVTELRGSSLRRREGLLWCAEQSGLAVVDVTAALEDLSAREGLSSVYLAEGEGHCTGPANTRIAREVAAHSLWQQP